MAQFRSSVSGGGGGGSGYVTIEDDGTPLPQETVINFTGAGVTVTDNPGVATVVNIPGGSAGAYYQTVQEGGTSLPQEAALNFVGASAVVADNPGVATNVTFAANLNAVAGLSPTAATLIVGNGTDYVSTAQFTAGSILFSNGTTITQDNANFNWNDANGSLTILQPSSVGTLATVVTITSDPSGAHGHGNHLAIDGNPGGGGTIFRTDGGLNDSWIQLTGGNYTCTEGGTLYVNGNNSTDGDAGGVQTTFGLSTSSFQMYDNTQSVLLFQLNNSGVLQLPALAPSSVVLTDASSNLTTGSVPGTLPWTAVTANTTMVAQHAYIGNSVGSLTFTLPSSLNVGDTFGVMNGTAPSWTIALNAGQTIYMGNVSTTTGTGGSLASTNIGDTVQLVAISTTNLRVLTAVGNINIV